MLSFSGKRDVTLLYLALASLAGGGAAYLIGSPMPFMIGGVFGSALCVFILESGGHQIGKLNPWLRPAGIAAIGVMIGTKVSPDLISHLPAFLPSVIAIVPFIVLAHAGSYVILRFVGKLPVTDAYFSSMPGGLVEAVMLGEKAGADLRVLTVQHFIRVLAIVVIVPMLFLLLTGEKVGSAAGENIPITAVPPFTITDFTLLCILSTLGAILGQKLRFPASHLIGPLILSAALALTGLVPLEVPEWLVHTAQYVVGTTLGAQISGINRAILKRGLGLGVLIITYLLSLGFLFASLLAPYVPASVPAMFVSFTAGGLTEMGLIALTLDLSPIIVVGHHLIRIFLTVWMGNRIYQSFIARRR